MIVDGRATRIEETRISADTDLDKLSGFASLSWISEPELKLLSAALAPAYFDKRQVVFRVGHSRFEVHILLKGIARITRQNPEGERFTIALIHRVQFRSFLQCRLGWICGARHIPIARSVI